MNKKLISLIIFLICIIAALPTVVFADEGPKPSIDITIKNLDTSNYLIDLFVYDSDGTAYESNANYNGRGLTEEQINKLHELNFDGWISESTRWDKYLLFADCAGNSKHQHNFSYFGTPERYKIVIINNDTGETKISDEIIRKDFNSIVTIDYNTMNNTANVKNSNSTSTTGTTKNSEVNTKTETNTEINTEVTTEVVSEPTVTNENNWKKTILVGVIALVITIAAELLIALIFKTKNYLAIAITNFVTNIALQSALIFISGNYLTMFIIGEVIVILTEVVVYLLSFKNVSKLKTVLYTLIANAVTIIASFLLYKI